MWNCGDVNWNEMKCNVNVLQLNSNLFSNYLPHSSSHSIIHFISHIHITTIPQSHCENQQTAKHCLPHHQPHPGVWYLHYGKKGRTRQERSAMKISLHRSVLRSLPGPEALNFQNRYRSTKPRALSQSLPSGQSSAPGESGNLLRV